MADPYIPPQDGPAQEWMTTFALGINNNPALYMLTAADALGIQNAVNLYVAARALTLVPATRNEVTITAKDDARISAEQICRQFAQLIKLNAGITDADKVAIGVRPVNPVHNPIDPPTSSPMVSIFAAGQGSQTLRYSDSNTPDSAAKPFGASQLQLYVAIDETPVSDPDQATFYGAFTKNPIGVAFDHSDNGKQASYFARWTNSKGEVGPWSFPVSMAIAA